MMVRNRLGDVPGGFDGAASRYDLLTSLNPGYRRHLESAADALVSALPSDHPADRPARLMDLGCGSGTSTGAILRSCRGRRIDASVVGIDNSAGMLGIARAKKWPAGVTFRCASVDEPETMDGEANSVDGVFAAYLFRNLADPDRALQRVHRLLAPGGTLVVVDYSVADSARARAVWTAVCRGFIIPASRFVGGNPGLYRYLWRSVREFDGIGTFADRCRHAGFSDVRHRTVPGWQRGILHMFAMTKPASAE